MLARWASSGGGVELGQQLAVGDDEAAGDAQAARLRLLEEDVLRGREVRAEHERARGAVGGSRAEEAPRSVARERLVGEPRLLGERAGAQPLQQLQPHRADDRELREVDVRVDEPGEQEAARDRRDLGVGMLAPDVREVARGEDRALGVEGDGAVVERLQRAGLRRTGSAACGRRAPAGSSSCALPLVRAWSATSRASARPASRSSSIVVASRTLARPSAATSSSPSAREPATTCSGRCAARQRRASSAIALPVSVWSSSRPLPADDGVRLREPRVELDGVEHVRCAFHQLCPQNAHSPPDSPPAAPVIGTPRGSRGACRPARAGAA